MAEIFRYAAFISYSSKDAAFAKRLHGALERYRIPASLGTFDLIGGGKPNRIYPVFRDREELSAGHLGDLIEANLRASAALIVICSPNAALSPWVQKEIEYFAALGRREKIFAIISDTAPIADDAGADATPSCFPPAFRSDALADANALEPLAADARKGKDGFRNASLKIVGGLVGVTPGQIMDRDRRRRREQAAMRGLAAAGAALVLSLIGAGIDARRWRADLTALADVAFTKQFALDAAALAVAGAPSESDVLAVALPNNAATPALGSMRFPTLFQWDTGSVEFSPRGRILVTKNDDVLQLRDAYSPTRMIVERPRPYVDQFTDDDRFYIAREETGHTYLYDLLEAAPEAILLGRFMGFHIAANSHSYFATTPNGDFFHGNFEHPEAPPTLLRNGGAIAEFHRIFNATDEFVAFWGPRQDISIHPVADPRAFRVLPGRFDNAIGISPDRRFLLARNLSGVVQLFDLATLNSINVPLGLYYNWNQSGSALIAIPEDRNATSGLLYDLTSLATASTPLRMPGLRSGYSVLDPTNRFLFNHTADGVTIRDLSASQAPVVFEGPSGHYLVSPDHRYLVVVSRSDLTIALYDMANLQAQPLDLGAGPELLFQAPGDGLMEFSPDGRFLVTTNASHISFLRDTRNLEAEPIVLGNVRTNFLATERAWLMTTQRAGFAAELRELVDAQATPIPNGHNGLNQRRISFDGARMIEMDPTFNAVAVRDLTIAAEGRGARLRSEICRASASAIRPFPTSLRTPPSGEPTPQGAEALKGRPWNPCDWRGLFAIFPDGDAGWFEGARQWLRLIAVRHLGAEDYGCAEINAAGTVSAQRQEMCRIAETLEARGVRGM